MSLDPLSLAEQLRSKDAHIAKMAGTLAHYRAWASQIQARYQMFNPDAARPARRIYVGGLPPDTEDVRSRPHILQSLLMCEADCSLSARPDAMMWDTAEAGVLVRMQVDLWQCFHMTMLSTEGWRCVGHALPPAKSAVVMKAGHGDSDARR